MVAASSNLSGKRVLVTRTQPDGASCPLTEALCALGASVINMPMVSITPVRFTASVEGVDWLFFTSPNAVRIFFEQVQSQGKLPQLGAVGEATANTLRKEGITADFVSPVFEAVEAGQAFVKKHNVQSRQILWPCGNLANTAFEEILTMAGARVTPCVVYDTTPRQDMTSEEKKQLSPAPDVITFTSPSAVQGWLNTQIPLPETSLIACIGPTTSEAAQTAFGRADITATPHTLDALATAIATHFVAK